MKKFVVRFWVNDRRVKPAMRLMARDIRDATGQFYALLGHSEFKYSSEDGSVSVSVQSSQITDYVLFVKDETDSTDG